MMTVKVNWFILLVLLCFRFNATAQQKDPANAVNVFLGTSGDHGQLSPAASYPFSMLSIGPQTYPKLHAGYEYEAKRFLGFTHNRFEGVGCQGSGGNLLIKPFIGQDYRQELIKSSQQASPGYYRVDFTNKITAEMTVVEKMGMHRYQFPKGEKGFFIDLAHTLANKFVAEEHQILANTISGWIEAKTTCNVGTYRIYYYLAFDTGIKITQLSAHELVGKLPAELTKAQIKVGLSSVSVAYAKASIGNVSFDALKQKSHQGWNDALSKISVAGNPEREKLFYSLLYRTLQSPYVISEPDGTFSATDGKIKKANSARYNGWAIWDNYRTQLPLLSIGWSVPYQDMVSSLAHLYEAGKKDFASQTEPSNTVRTEHTIVVLLDSYRKGYQIDFEKIADSLIKEVDQLDYSKPDKALESSYDTWALSEILTIIGRKQLSEKYGNKALAYKQYWNKDFKDITKPDVDKVQARGLYQGTIWQYRWFAPFDNKGLINLMGGMDNYLSELNEFFEQDKYNHANEPDLQAPLMYNFTPEHWKSQELMHRFAVDTVIQYYFNENSKGIDPFVDVVYKNEPKAFIRTMDDDAGAMSGWFVLTACGIMPACPGWPIYYLNVPLFSSVSIQTAKGKTLTIKVENFAPNYKYIKSVKLNGKVLNRNYVTHQEINDGGELVFEATATPTSAWPLEKWISEVH
jgi:putative alpha-1,2-mannosidase